MATSNDKRPDIVGEIIKRNPKTLSDDVSDIFKNTSIGSLSTAIGDSFYGINHRQTPSAIQINKDYFGLTFFTRPKLNLSSANLRTVRIMTPMLSTEENSIQRIIRCLLDRSLESQGIKCSLIDNRQAFIPILTNHLLSMSGWPDVTAPTNTSQEGMYKESFSMVDGITDIYSTYDISANFRNIPGDPITLLFLTWAHYASHVYRGTMVPYPNMIVENEIDYQTRIYRLVLDSTKTRVSKIGACGAGFPMSSPIGKSFDFEHDRPINASNDQISIPFRCMGAIYQDDILIDEFNRTTMIFNPALAPGRRENEYTKVSIEELGIFNNRGYPRINPNTYELEWWVPNDVYELNMPSINSRNAVAPIFMDSTGSNLTYA